MELTNIQAELLEIIDIQLNGQQIDKKSPYDEHQKYSIIKNDVTSIKKAMGWSWLRTSIDLENIDRNKLLNAYISLLSHSIIFSVNEYTRYHDLDSCKERFANYIKDYDERNFRINITNDKGDEFRYICVNLLSLDGKSRFATAIEMGGYLGFKWNDIYEAYKNK